MASRAMRILVLVLSSIFSSTSPSRTSTTEARIPPMVSMRSPRLSAASISRRFLSSAFLPLLDPVIMKKSRIMTAKNMNSGFIQNGGLSVGCDAAAARSEAA